VQAATVNRQSGSWTLLDLLEQAPGLLALSDTLIELAEQGAPIVALTGDLMHSNGLVRFAERFPERFFNMGIAEQNMVTVAAGMATTGLIPFVADFASFLGLLCCEQIRTDVAYSKLPVRLIGHHAGITLGFYGTTHHSTEDLAIMRAIADLTVVAPSDPRMLSAALRASIAHEEPIWIRIGRGRDPDVYSDETIGDFRFGRAIWHERGKAATVIATGSMVCPALAAVRALATEGCDIGFVDMHTIKPIDRDAILQAADESPLLITVEEHNVIGGLGGAVAETLADVGADVRLHRHGIRDTFSLIGPPTHLYAHYALDEPGIRDVLRNEIKRTNGGTAKSAGRGWS
jgi:transketolase